MNELLTTLEHFLLKDILYIIDREDEQKIMTINGPYIYKGSLHQMLEPLYLEQLTTIKGRRDALRLLANLKYNVPHFITTKCFLIKMQSKPLLWVNYYNIVSVKEQIISFVNQKKIKVRSCPRTIKKLLHQYHELDIIIREKIIS